MEKILSFIFILLIFTNAISQDKDSGKFDIQWGDDFKMSSKYKPLNLLGTEEDGYFHFSEKPLSKLQVNQFDGKTLSLKTTYKLNLKKLPRSYLTEFVAHRGDNYYLLYSHGNRKKKEDNLHALRYDKVSGEFAEDKSILSGSLLTGLFKGVTSGKFRVVDKYNYDYSLDKSKMLVHYMQKPTVRNNNKSYPIFGVHVYDENLERLWGRDFKMPYLESEFSVVRYLVDSKGVVYLLVKIYDSEEQESATGTRTYSALLKFQEGSTEAEEIKIDTYKKYTFSSKISEDDQGGIFFASYYSNYKTTNTVDGILTAKIDKNGNLVNESNKYHEFPSDVMDKFYKGWRVREQLRKEKAGKNADSEIPGLYMKEIHYENGDMIIVGEQFRIKEYAKNNPNSPSGVTIERKYFYEDIIVTKINKSGKFEWINRIPKFQKGDNTNYMLSYKYFSANDNNYFLYYDKAENLNLPSDKTPEVYRGKHRGVLVLVKIDANGILTKEKVLSVRDHDYHFDPTDLRETARNTFVAKAYYKSNSAKLKVVKLTFLE